MRGAQEALTLKKGKALVLRIVHVAWGLPQSLVGACIAGALHGRNRYAYRSALVTEWRLSAGLSLGLFVFVPHAAPAALVVHEYGHSVQSLILGPLYLPVVVVPSLVWAGLPACERYRVRHHMSYYAHPLEHWANVLGERVTGQRAPR